MWKMVMMVVVMMVMMMVMTPGDAYEVTNQHPAFTPAGENCTQSLGNLLQLRLLETVTTQAAVINQIRDAVLANKEMLQATNENCQSPWSVVGSNCLLLAFGVSVNWADARQYCVARGGDLVTFRDANTFAEILDHIRFINPQNRDVSVWVGGSDAEVEGQYRWVTGEAMPRESPFWGSQKWNSPEPNNDPNQDCVVLWHPDRYYLHDQFCDRLHAPLCQKPNGFHH